MLFVGIYVSTWFTLFISALTILHSMFLNDGKVVFSLLKILFKFFKINFCSYVSIRLLCWIVFCWVGFPFSEVGWFWMGCFCLLIFAVSGDVFLLSWSFIFWCISIISSSENQPFFNIVLTWSASLWLVVWKIERSCHISIILFLYPLCVGLLLK